MLFKNVQLLYRQSDTGWRAGILGGLHTVADGGSSVLAPCETKPEMPRLPQHTAFDARNNELPIGVRRYWYRWLVEFVQRWWSAARSISPRFPVGCPSHVGIAPASWVAAPLPVPAVHESVTSEHPDAQELSPLQVSSEHVPDVSDRARGFGACTVLRGVVGKAITMQASSAAVSCEVNINCVG
ncbi:hypothetical protein ON010_g17207 [Phytophthora cinnamomi]|nr:hypothetical protein ON010_g17207 [Phytophthora cinnamomi]